MPQRHRKSQKSDTVPPGRLAQRTEPPQPPWEEGDFSFGAFPRTPLSESLCPGYCQVVPMGLASVGADLAVTLSRLFRQYMLTVLLAMFSHFVSVRNFSTT